MKYTHLIGLVLLGVAACSKAPVTPERTLSPEQGKLISMTADALLSLPDMPHERTKNREMNFLIDLLVQSNDLVRAEQYHKEITNWRSDQLQANIATRYYQLGDVDHAEKLIADVGILAETVAGLKAGTMVATGEFKNYMERYDDYRLDRIKVALAKYHWVKGDKDIAKKLSEDVLPSEQADFIKMQGEALLEESYDGALEIFSLLARGETFEGKIAAVDGLVKLHGIYYDDEEKREAMKSLVYELTPPLPIMFRIRWLQDMAVSAFKHGDAEAAEQFYHDASLLIADSELTPRMFFPLKSSNIITAYQLDHREDALEAADLLSEEYEKIKGSVFDIHRADVLCSIAEAFAYMGEMSRAEALYLDALDQADENPNSRPRVEDLNLIVRSLVQYNVPISPELVAAVQGLTDGLGDPW